MRAARPLWNNVSQIDRPAHKAAGAAAGSPLPFRGGVPVPVGRSCGRPGVARGWRGSKRPFVRRRRRWRPPRRIASRRLFVSIRYRNRNRGLGRTGPPARSLRGRRGPKQQHVAVAGACVGQTTLSGGSLGSCVDEERSQLRELMWIAGHIEYQYLERIWRLGVTPRATPVSGSVGELRRRAPPAPWTLEAAAAAVRCARAAPSSRMQVALRARSCARGRWLAARLATPPCRGRRALNRSLDHPSTWDQTRLPAEFKHITKRRKRN